MVVLKVVQGRRRTAPVITLRRFQGVGVALLGLLAFFGATGPQGAAASVSQLETALAGLHTEVSKISGNGSNSLASVQVALQAAITTATNNTVTTIEGPTSGTTLTTLANKLNPLPSQLATLQTTANSTKVKVETLETITENIQEFLGDTFKP